MADKIQFQVISCPTNTSQTSTFLVDKYDQAILFVPNVSTTFASAVILATLQGSPVSGVTAQDLRFYDYINGTPKTCCVTIATAGAYEFPYPGAMQYLKVKFDVATSNVTNCYLMTPKTTY